MSAEELRVVDAFVPTKLQLVLIYLARERKIPVDVLEAIIFGVIESMERHDGNRDAVFEEAARTAVVFRRRGGAIEVLKAATEWVDRIATKLVSA